jgi:hypothetical protein
MTYSKAFLNTCNIRLCEKIPQLVNRTVKELMFSLDRFQDAPSMWERVFYAKQASNHALNEASIPHVEFESILARWGMKQHNEHLLMTLCESSRRSAARLGLQCVVAATAVLLEPLVHCRSTHSQGRGNSCWGPPSLKQLNCSKSTALLDPTI